jgi:hypothetical protein
MHADQDESTSHWLDMHCVQEEDDHIHVSIGDCECVLFAEKHAVSSRSRTEHGFHF